VFRPLSTLTLSVGLLACGCNSPIDISQQEVRVRYDAATDACDLLLIYKGLTATSEKDVPRALDDVLIPALKGRREFVIAGVHHWNLDDPKKPTDLRALRANESVKLEEAGIFLDEDKLAGFQRFRMRGVSHALRDWNQMVSEDLLDVARGARLDENDLLDARSRELVLARARSGEPWVRLLPSELEIDLPLSRATTKELRKQVAKSIACSAEMSWLAKPLSYVTALRVEDERLVMRLGSPDDGLYTFVLGGPKSDYSPALLEALRERGYAPDPTLSLEAVRAKVARKEGDVRRE
jgi:hypothetical protein